MFYLNRFESGKDDSSSEAHFQIQKTTVVEDLIYAQNYTFFQNILILSRDPVPLNAFKERETHLLGGRGGRTVELNYRIASCGSPWPEQGNAWIRMVCAFSLGEKLLGFGVVAYVVRYSLQKIGGLLLLNMPMPMQQLQKSLV
jgi:hypothetical protein